ncbi:putative aldolase [Anaeramoeba ignava]|uniref:deoxyribose-phosphate aldolase n=1 Tax=Anaeramoeba ignava TaxID=1746090 RepID=A0A9Q0LFV9_ANAIG|nr:putative aldolase [Anaeramoeba ignava]
MNFSLTYDKETKELIQNRINFTSKRINILPEQLRAVFPHLLETEMKFKMNEDISSYIDHTLLKPDATKEQIKQLCQEAIDNKFYAVCVNSNRVKEAFEFLGKNSVQLAAVVGFPLGVTDTNCKIFETETAIDNGATEIDMVINVGRLKDEEYFEVLSDIREVVKSVDESVKVKVILETCLLTKELIVDACILSVIGGASFVKTSTGFSQGGAKVEDVRLMKLVVGDLAEVKASGGVRSYEDAMKMIANGATRIGTSSGVKISKEKNDVKQNQIDSISDQNLNRNSSSSSFVNPKIALCGAFLTAAISGFFAGYVYQQNSQNSNKKNPKKKK